MIRELGENRRPVESTMSEAEASAEIICFALHRSQYTASQRFAIDINTLGHYSHQNWPIDTTKMRLVSPVRSSQFLRAQR